MLKCLQQWREQGLAWRDMAVLHVAKYQGGDIAKKLKALGIPYLWMPTKQHKNKYDPAANYVAVLTIHSSKGLEFQHGVIVGIGQLNDDTRQQQDARLLYVGMTRAQQQLRLATTRQTGLSLKILEL